MSLSGGVNSRWWIAFPPLWALRSL